MMFIVYFRVHVSAHTSELVRSKRASAHSCSSARTLQHISHTIIIYVTINVMGCLFVCEYLSWCVCVFSLYVSNCACTTFG